MKGRSEILKRLKEHVKEGPVLVPAKVISVDETNLTCKIEIEGLQFNARLNAAENSVKGLVIIPAVNSWVLAGRLDDNGNVWAVLSFTAADKIIMRNGENGGLINVEDLVEKINNLEQKIMNHQHLYLPGPGSPTPTTTDPTTNPAFTQTAIADIEDDKILH